MSLSNIPGIPVFSWFCRLELCNEVARHKCKRPLGHGKWFSDLLRRHFCKRMADSIVVNVNGRLEEYQILAVNSFNSTRKRMSTVARAPDGRVWLWVKGADNETRTEGSDLGKWAFLWRETIYSKICIRVYDAIYECFKCFKMKPIAFTLDWVAEGEMCCSFEGMDELYNWCISGQCNARVNNNVSFSCTPKIPKIL